MAALLEGELWLIRPKEYLLALSPEHLLHQTGDAEFRMFLSLLQRTILYIKILDVFGYDKGFRQRLRYIATSRVDLAGSLIINL
jgi:hypothetical protein